MNGDTMKCRIRSCDDAALELPEEVPFHETALPPWHGAEALAPTKGTCVVPSLYREYCARHFRAATGMEIHRDAEPCVCWPDDTEGHW